MGEKRNEYRILVGKPDGKRPLGRPRRRQVYTIKMVLRYRLGWDGMDWIELHIVVVVCIVLADIFCILILL
jgi:hypothetical protein